jgi:hypothetical protein
MPNAESPMFTVTRVHPLEVTTEDKAYLLQVMQDLHRAEKIIVNSLTKAEYYGCNNTTAKGNKNFYLYDEAKSLECIEKYSSYIRGGFILTLEDHIKKCRKSKLSQYNKNKKGKYKIPEKLFTMKANVPNAEGVNPFTHFNHVLKRLPHKHVPKMTYCTITIVDKNLIGSASAKKGGTQTWKRHADKAYVTLNLPCETKTKTKTTPAKNVILKAKVGNYTPKGAFKIKYNPITQLLELHVAHTCRKSLAKNGGAVGVDKMMNGILALSDGTVVAPKGSEKYEAQMRWAKTANKQNANKQKLRSWFYAKALKQCDLNEWPKRPSRGSNESLNAFKARKRDYNETRNKINEAFKALTAKAGNLWATPQEKKRHLKARATIENHIGEAINKIEKKYDTIYSEDLTWVGKAKAKKHAYKKPKHISITTNNGQRVNVRVDAKKQTYFNALNSNWLKGVIAERLEAIKKKYVHKKHQTVNAAYTSQRCHKTGSFGYRDGAVFTSLDGSTCNSDVNAACNILHYGQSGLAFQKQKDRFVELRDITGRVAGKLEGLVNNKVDKHVRKYIPAQEKKLGCCSSSQPAKGFSKVKRTKAKKDMSSSDESIS